LNHKHHEGCTEKITLHTLLPILECQFGLVFYCHVLAANFSMRFCNWATPLCSHQCERNAPSWVQVSFPLHRILFPTDFECLAWICPPCLILLPPSSVSKMMFSLNSVLSINWCYFQLIPFLASLPFTAAVPTKYVHNETLISPRLNGQFRIMNCNSVQGNAIIAALQEIVNVVSTLTFR
jgi:hypothetical protein